MPLRDWMQLTMTAGLGGVLCKRLVEAAGNAASACTLQEQQLRAIEGIGAARAGRIRRALDEAAAETEIEMLRAASANVQMVCPDDSDYPLLLLNIPDPPGVLYVKGSLQPRDLHGVAVVGSRKCTFYGREQAERFGALLGGAGITVLSGGARGVDSAAHRGALSHPSGRTIAVLGCGIDVVYPPENASLFDQIGAKGAIVSEYAIGTPPRAENFPRRNRIVSGMSRGVLVIEAGERSGALITARQACDDHGRPVFALPGRVDNELSGGPHRLIRDGAILTTGLDDILENLMPLPDAARANADACTTAAHLFSDVSSVALPASASKTLEPQIPASAPPASTTPAAFEIGNLTATQRTIMAQIEPTPVAVDTIIDRSALPASIVLQELTLLTLKGAIRRVAEGYCRK